MPSLVKQFLSFFRSKKQKRRCEKVSKKLEKSSKLKTKKSKQPEEQSKNILEILNDDCIKEIFNHLTNLSDFLAVAEVCVRFRENAKQCFPTRFNSVQVNVQGRAFWSLNQLERILDIFGPSIRTMNLNFVKYSFQNQKVFNMIADKTGPNLKELSIVGRKIKMNTQFQSLEILSIDRACLKNFNSHAQLKVLRFLNQSASNCDWLIQSFPKLTEIEFSGVDDLTDDMLMNFLTLNPQLTELKIAHCMKIFTSVVPQLGPRISNIGKIHFESKRTDLPTTVGENLLEISRTKGLKNFKFSCHNAPNDAIIESMSKTNPDISYAVSARISFCPDRYPESTLRLAGLRYLSVNNLSSDHMLIQIVKDVRFLKRFTVDKSYGITVDGIKETLKSGKHLEFLSISLIEPISISLDDLASIRNLTENRIKVKLNLKNAIISKDDILTANCEWLNVKIVKG